MPTASVQAQRFKVLLAGVFSQILCIGIARFAYTPLLPVMQQQSWISDADGGWLAALNYAGYMLGAVLAASIFHFGEFTVAQAKQHMADAGIPMRLS